MGRRSDDYHVMMDGRSCPSGRKFTWNKDGTAQCLSCGRRYPDHVRSDEPGKRNHCIICREVHAV